MALAYSCLAKAQNKQETKDMHQYAEVCQFKSEEEDPDNCDSMDGVVRRPESNMASEEGFRVLNEFEGEWMLHYVQNLRVAFHYVAHHCSP